MKINIIAPAVISGHSQQQDTIRFRIQLYLSTGAEPLTHVPAECFTLTL